MSEQELAEFRRRVMASRESRTRSAEAARKVLLDEGVITSDGRLTETYGGDKATS